MKANRAFRRKMDDRRSKLRQNSGLKKKGKTRTGNVSVKTVAHAAPTPPKRGISIKFKNKLNNTWEKATFATMACLLAAFKLLAKSEAMKHKGTYQMMILKIEEE